MPFRRILIPTDFSTASEWVFADAARLAAKYGAEVVILHVRMTWASNPEELRFPADPSLYEYAEQLELDRLREHVRRINPSVNTRLIVRKAPDPGEEICRTARAEEADLIVMATHARHHVAHLLVGSTTLSLLRNPPAPILAIRYGTRQREAFNRLLVLVDCEDSFAAVDLARDLGSEIHLLTICKQVDRAEREKLLREAAERVPGAKQSLIVSDDQEKEVLRYATRHDVDAILLSDGEPSEGKLDIVRHAPVPVMLVPWESLRSGTL